ncbi:MAG TPA: 2-oxo-4-hydroxy-4-carboxy-5-ureidoimidazoline decarboxylase [Candidatus Solibacter sp.]|nr:2-oxo-4-hydroxy-4-carboxy-5-ureidoimidazoline decarboxylase [Candidatus Solibacter sp.]
MRSHPVDYELVAHGTLPAVLSLLAREPGAWLPIAGGTDVMVQFAAGKLPARKLVSIWNLPELRRFDVTPDEIQIGAGCTYTDLRQNECVFREFPLLSRAARWTGGIANQNRGTIGGNIVNASPAADSLPALLVYEADLLLISSHGERRLPYANFHLDYRRTQLAPDELIRAVCLKRHFSTYLPYARKVGARNAQAIAKVCLAALGRFSAGRVEDVRLALGSVAPVPLRLLETERFLKGKQIDPHCIHAAKLIVAAEIRPISDIRSTAQYRTAVAANLVAEFLGQLRALSAPGEKKNIRLEKWNAERAEDAAQSILPCCGSKAWARGMTARRPILDEASLLAASDDVWNALSESDWLEAFRSHPRIGESHPPAHASTQSAAWSGEEQGKAALAEEAVRLALAEANRAYERRFHRTFIVCASGISASEILAILLRRLQNEDSTELREAAGQQRKIAQIRLKKWLSS